MRNIQFTDDLEENIILIWLGTFGNIPNIPDRDDTTGLIDKFGLEKTYEIMYKAARLGFKKMKTLVNAVDDNGNIKPKTEKSGMAWINEKKEVKKDIQSIVKIVDPQDLKKILSSLKLKRKEVVEKELTKEEKLERRRKEDEFKRAAKEEK